MVDHDDGRPLQVAAKIKHSVIVAHPEAESFTMAVARRYCAAVASQGQEALLRDLYRMGFDPVLKSDERARDTSFQPRPDVAAELDHLAGSAAFVLIYPIWFGTPPAIMKGYVERVLGAGMTAKSMTHHLGQAPHPLLGGKHLLSFTSSGASLLWLSEQSAWSALETIFDGYIARAFWMDTPGHIHFDEVTDGLDRTVAEDYLGKVEQQAATLCRQLAAAQAPPQ